MPQPKKVKLSSLKPDPRNANRGTERGLQVLEQSLEKFGAGRSILVDKHGTVIAGNKTLETAGAIGLDDVIVVETDGTKLVAVKRTDLDLATDIQARELAYADNRVGELGLEWDAKQIAHDLEEIDGLGLPGWTEDEVKFIVDARNDPDFESEIEKRADSKDGISRIVVYCPEDILEEVWGKVREFCQQWQGIIVQVKHGF